MKLTGIFQNIFPGFFSQKPQPSPAAPAVTEKTAIPQPVPPPPFMPRDDQGRLKMDHQNFSDIIGMFHSGANKFEKALLAAAEDRSSKKVYDVAIELHCLVFGCKHCFLWGPEKLWMDSAAKLYELAEEAAQAPDASPSACNLAGMCFGSSRQFGYDCPEITPIEADLTKALYFFEKGAALGDPDCANNAVLARERIAKATTVTAPPQPLP